MLPAHEHAFYLWLIIVGAVCIITFAGAIIDRFFLYRRLRQRREAVRSAYKPTPTPPSK